ncbi:MAG TPA: type II secretion system minor pseudopilin GspI [Rubrivivax sp.]|nr:type II secretion system minor pseudopilin GspI [Rubrivivax sp.]
MKRGARGFTLVEVLVAVTVIAVALAAGLRAAGVLIDNSQRLSDVIAAQWCAENHLTQLKLMRQFPGIGQTDFACEQLGRQYSGRAQVAGTQYGDLRLVDATVSDAAGRQLVRLSTLLYRP